MSSGDKTAQASSAAAAAAAAATAGSAMVKLVSQAHFVELRDFEKKMIGESFAKFYGSPEFARYHLKAVTTAFDNIKHEDAQFLIKKDIKGDLFKSETDILRHALLSKYGTLRRPELESKYHKESIKLLIDHGYNVQVPDSLGNSALFYTCALGFPQTFKLLLENGADPTLHHTCLNDARDAYPSEEQNKKARGEGLSKIAAEEDWNVSRPKMSSGFNDKHDSRAEVSVPTRSGKVDFLQIAFDAYSGTENGTIDWTLEQTSLDETWAPIFMALLDAGLRLEQGTPGPVLLFQNACYQGNIELVRKLIQHKVDLSAGRKGAPYMERIFGSPLHVAAIGGRQEVADLLLERGYNPSDIRRHYGWRGIYNLTPIDAAFSEVTPWRHDSDRRRVLLVCENMVNVGVSQRDLFIFLRECAKDGHIDILERLKHVSMDGFKVPTCDRADVVRFLVEKGATVDVEELQLHAIKRAAPDLFKYLVQKFGLNLKRGNKFDAIMCSLIEEKLLTKVLDFLISECGFDINLAWPSPHVQRYKLDGAYGTTLLKTACRILDVEAVSDLLRRGADPLEPHHSKTAFHVLREQVKLIPSKSVSASHIQIFQLLLAYSQNDASRKSEARDRLTAKSTDLKNYLATLAEAFSGASAVTWTSIEDMDDSSDNDNEEFDDSASLDDADKDDESEGDFNDEMSTDDEDQRSDKSVEISYIGQGRHPKPHLVEFKTIKGKYKYRPLKGPYFTRVLLILPSLDLESPINCRLLHVDLSKNVKYEALSYVWGNASEKAHIIVEDTNFPVTLNLWAALCRLRLRDKPRVIWADAICINQSDIPERNQQVSIMKDVYSSAARVLVWFGENFDDSELIFEHMNRWREWRDDYLQGRASPKYDRRGAEKPHWLPPMFSGRTREAFRKFCTRAWFSRTWTIQEKLLAKNPIIMCGPYAEDWERINTAATYSPKTYIRLNQKLHLAAQRFRRRDFELTEYDLVRKSRVSSGKSYTPLVGMDAAAHFENLIQLSRGGREFSKVMPYSSLCQATEPRDKVYGLLALFDKELVKVDYSLPVSKVYGSFIQAIIESENELSVLHWFGHQRSKLELPSWVPDLSTAKPTGLLPRKIFDRDCESTLLPGYHFDDNNKFTAKGFSVAKVKLVSELLAAEPAPAPGSDEFARVFRSWESVAATLATGGQRQKRSFKRPLVDAFLETMLAYDDAVTFGNSNVYHEWGEIDDEKFSCNAPYFVEWYRRYGTGVLQGMTDGGSEYFREFDVVASWWTQLQTQHERDKAADEFTDMMADRCYGRALFVADTGTLGLAPPNTRPGDDIVFLPGAQYPFVVRPSSSSSGGAAVYNMLGDCYLYRHNAQAALLGAEEKAIEYTFE